MLQACCLSAFFLLLLAEGLEFKRVALHPWAGNVPVLDSGMNPAASSMLTTRPLPCSLTEPPLGLTGQGRRAGGQAWEFQRRGQALPPTPAIQEL